MTLRKCVESIESYELKSASEILAAITAQTISKESHELLSWQGVGKYLGFMVGMNIRAEWERAIADTEPYKYAEDENARNLARGLRAINEALIAENTDFALEEIQVGLEQQRQFLSAYGIDVDALKKLGRWSEAPWQQPEYGLVEAPTEEEIQSVLDAIELEQDKQSKLEKGASDWNKFVAALDAWDGTGDAPRLALFDGVE